MARKIDLTKKEIADLREELLETQNQLANLEEQN